MSAGAAFLLGAALMMLVALVRGGTTRRAYYTAGYAAGEAHGWTQGYDAGSKHTGGDNGA